MSSDAQRPGLVRRATRGVAVGVLALVAVSVAIRLTVRDRVPGLAAVFYATPPALDVLGALFACVVLRRGGRRRASAFAGALAAASLGLLAFGQLRFAEPRPPGAIHGVHWNVAHGYWGWPRIAETLATLDPDVAWLSESDDDASMDDALRAALPGRLILHEKSGLTVIVRGEATCVERVHVGGAGRLAQSRIVVGGRAFDSIHVDAPSNPLADRARIFDAVLKYVEPRLGAPLVVVGDFNTPRDSTVFDAWRGPLAHAFETAGRGFDATWPVPLPVLSIDHVWAGGGLAVRTWELRWTRLSDHRPVEFTFDVP